MDLNDITYKINGAVFEVNRVLGGGYLEKIYEKAQAIDQKTMTLEYFDTLKSLGASESTKYIFPMEFTSLISDFVKGQK